MVFSFLTAARAALLAAPLVLAGCVNTLPGLTPYEVTGVHSLSGRALPQDLPLIDVAARMEPVIEASCRRLRTGNCDYVVAVDDDPTMPPNAFQTLDHDGRPVVVFTWALLQLARNGDELAFVLGHEAAHHIAGHIGRRESEARSGAILAAGLAQAAGLPRAEVGRAQEIGASLAAQRYSKEYELEADALGAALAWEAGFDPRRGAQFFLRLPDPVDHALTSHPPNAQRRAVVEEAIRKLEAG